MRSSIIILLFQFIVFYAFGQYEDTCIIIKPGSSDDNDAIIHGLDIEKNIPHPKSPEISMNAWTFGGTPGIVRSVIDFEIDKHVPIGMPIISAKLYLYAWNRMDGMGPHESLSGSNAAWCERVITAWDKDTVTWNNQPITTHLHRVSLSKSNSPGENYVLDVTQLIKDMRDHPSTSFGFLFRLKTEDYYRRLTFCSANYPNPKLHPKLVICSKIPLPPPTLPSPCNGVNHMKIFPIPSNENMNIFIKDLNEAIDIRIYDCIGRKIFDETLNQEVSKICTAHLSQGVYILEFNTSNCGVIRKKFVVNH